MEKVLFRRFTATLYPSDQWLETTISSEALMRSSSGLLVAMTTLLTSESLQARA